jgi:glycogen operon protein
MIRLRKNHPVFRRKNFFSVQKPEIEWFDAESKTPDWGKMKRFLGFKISGSGSRHENGTPDNDFYVAANTDIYDITLNLPLPPRGKKWYRVVDTSIDGSDCISSEGNEELLNEQMRYVLPASGFLILMSK